MRRQRLLWQLFPSYLLITLLSLGGVVWYASRALHRYSVERTAAALLSRARLVEGPFLALARAGDPGAVDRACKGLGERGGVRITVIRPSGRVMGDSDEDPAHMDNHADRPEIRSSRSEGRGRSVRYSHTLGKEMVYVAVPLGPPAEDLGTLRLSTPLRVVTEAASSPYIEIVLAGLVAAAVAALVSLWVARRIARPLEAMRRGAESFAAGELTHRLRVHGSEEIAALADALNRMALELDERIRTIVEQRNEQQAILSAMVEGVLAVDAEERVIWMNEAAASMLAVRMEPVQDRSIQEVVRHPDLQTFVADTLRADRPLEGQFTFLEPEERYLQAHGTVLSDRAGVRAGAVVVLNDVTRMRRLENVRKEFVANVSHELKTPITSIKGYIETLLEGALDEPGDARRFLAIVARQVERLHAIVEDLLALSRIERDATARDIALSEAEVRGPVEAALQTCRAKAQRKSIALVSRHEEGLRARINAPLLEQAVVNLVDNAVKYSPEGTEVTVESASDGTGLAIRVTDQGMGIDPGHLPRIFERFYVVDKARTRKLGGTGLGLAIVKHIAQAHGGSVDVDSRTGRGSTFTLRLPGP